MSQQEALEILKLGYNVLLTGPAGSGKTFVLESFISGLKFHEKKVAVTATTGIAATYLKGLTIHSWSGIGIKNTLSAAEIENLLKRRYLRKRFNRLDVLIIDEVSMLQPETLEMVDILLREFKKTTEPFGGVQLILSGDFFQLPPVTRENEKTRYIFESPLWEDLDLKICYLDKPYRQYDNTLIHMLEEIRSNTVTSKTWQLLKERFLLPVDSAIAPTKLFTHNRYADTYNIQELAKIQEPTHVYQMRCFGNSYYHELLKNSCLSPEKLLLKKGALVMFTKNNLPEGYVNGTTGKVLEFTEEGYPVIQTFEGKIIQVESVEWVLEEDGEILAKVRQLPLRLAWAITVHKSQGMTLDAVELDLGKSFTNGLGYVALSRVRTLQGIKMRSLNRTALQINPTIMSLDKKLKEQSEAIVEELHSSPWYKKNKQ